MNLRWKRDRNHNNCWDLTLDEKVLGYTIQVSGSEVIEWCARQDNTFKETPYPGRTIDEVKAIVEALVLLEG